MGIVVLLLLGACTSGMGSTVPAAPAAPSARETTPQRPVASAVAPQAGPGEPGAVVARVDGQPILAGDAFRLIYLAAPDEASNAVRQLVVDRIAAAEAAAIGASVPPAVLDREFARLLAEQERKVQEASKGKSDLAGYVKSTFRIDMPAYQAIVRGSLERSLLLQRVVRHEISLHPRIQLRLIRVKERKLADEIRTKLAQGADFAALARQHSEDGAARDGGVYPPLPSDLPSPLIEKTGELAAGAISDVEEVSTPDGPRFRIVQVLARLPAETGSYAERAAAIEQALEGRPLSPLELEAWTRMMEDRHQIRLLGMGSEDDGS